MRFTFNGPPHQLQYGGLIVNIGEEFDGEEAALVNLPPGTVTPVKVTKDPDPDPVPDDTVKSSITIPSGASKK